MSIEYDGEWYDVRMPMDIGSEKLMIYYNLDRLVSESDIGWHVVLRVRVVVDGRGKVSVKFSETEGTLYDYTFPKERSIGQDEEGRAVCEPLPCPDFITAAKDYSQPDREDFNF